MVRRADFNNDSYVQEFGLTISNNMMEVRGRVLPPPKLQYGGRVSSISGQVSSQCDHKPDGYENIQMFYFELCLQKLIFHFHTCDNHLLSSTVEKKSQLKESFSAVDPFIF